MLRVRRVWHGTFGRHGPVAVPVVAVRGRQLVKFRLVPDEHVPAVARTGAIFREATGGIGRRRCRGRRRRARTAAAAGDGDAERRRHVLLVTADDGAHVGHKADAGVLLLLVVRARYPAASASIPSAAGHQPVIGGDNDAGPLLRLLHRPPIPLLRMHHRCIGQPATVERYII